MDEIQLQVIPIDDEIEHTFDDCQCDPFTDQDGMVIHHSRDGREKYERQGVLGKPWELVKLRRSPKSSHDGEDET